MLEGRNGHGPDDHFQETREKRRVGGSLASSGHRARAARHFLRSSVIDYEINTSSARSFDYVDRPIYSFTITDGGSSYQ